MSPLQHVYWHTPCWNLEREEGGAVASSVVLAAGKYRLQIRTKLQSQSGSSTTHCVDSAIPENAHGTW